MVKKVKLFVELKIPDTAARTAFHTLEHMGYDSLKDIRRYDYYEFEIDGNEKDFFFSSRTTSEINFNSFVNSS